MDVREVVERAGATGIAGRAGRARAFSHPVLQEAADGSPVAHGAAVGLGLERARGPAVDVVGTVAVGRRVAVGEARLGAGRPVPRSLPGLARELALPRGAPGQRGPTLPARPLLAVLVRRLHALGRARARATVAAHEDPAPVCVGA